MMLCESLSCFGWRFRVLVQLCVLRGDENNSRGYLFLSARPHPMFLVKSCGVAMFSEMYGFFVNDVKNVFAC